MKRISVLLLALLVLAGCSDARVKPTTNETIFTINNQKVDEAKLFEVMKRADSGQLIISHSENVISKDAKDDSIEEKAQKQLADAKEYLKDEFDAFLKSINIKDEAEYLEKIVYPQVRMEFTVKKAIEDDYAALVAEYAPKKARMLQVDTTEAAEAALERIKAGEDFGTVAADVVSASATYKGEEKIYNLKGTEYPSVISKFLTAQTTPGLSDILKDETTGISYIVEVIETQEDRFKEEALELWTKDTTITKKYKVKLFSDNNFAVYDKDVHTGMSTNFKDYLPTK